MPTSGSPPAPDTSPLSEVDRRALTRFLEEGLDHGFRLAVIEVAGKTAREAILTGLTAQVGPDLLRLTLSELPGAEANLWSALRDSFAAHAPRVLALCGLEDDPRADWPRQLNVQRDLFTRDIAVPWLLFIDPATRVPLLKAAPDFCDLAILWLRSAPLPDMSIAEVDLTSLRGESDPLLQQAHEAFNAAHFAHARDLLTAFELRPKNRIRDTLFHALLASVLEQRQGHLVRAEALLRDTRNTYAPRSNDPEVQDLMARIEAELGHNMLLQQRFVEAEGSLKTALSLSEMCSRTDSDDYIASLINLAITLSSQNKSTDAEEVFLQALTHIESSLGSRHLSYINALSNYGFFLSYEGRDGEAEPLFRRAVVLIEEEQGIEHPDLCLVLEAFGLSLIKQNRSDEALPLLDRARRVGLKVFGPNHPQVRSVEELIQRYSFQPDTSA